MIPSEAPPVFDDAFRDRLADLFAWRRDVRRFKRDAIDETVLRDCIAAACLGPSVGNAQPWRFVRVTDRARRDAVAASFQRCNDAACATYADERQALYARLKLEGLRDAPVHLAVFCDEGTPVGFGLGRATMPEMLRYSVVTAVHGLWLAARAHGIGLGWVSILEPEIVTRLLDVPPEWRLIAYLCIGYPAQEHRDPELERHGWQARLSSPCEVIER